MTRYARRPDVLWRLGVDRVLARRLGGQSLDLLGASAMVWVALDQPRSLADLQHELAAVAIVTGDVEQVLSDLLDRDLIEIQQ